MHELKIRSHLMCYADRYEEEADLLREVRLLGLTSRYFEVRRNWHRLPEFDRLVPRPPLDLPKDADSSPSPATLA